MQQISTAFKAKTKPLKEASKPSSMEANLLQNLSPLLSSISLLLMLANHTLSQSTYFSFDSFRSKLTHHDLTYQGDAHVPSGSSFLRLTKTDAAGHPQMDSVGRVLYSKPLQLWKPADTSVINFETTIKFTIKPLKGYPAGDGLAFFIVPVGSTIPGSASGGNLGIVDVTGTSAALFAVEFDLYRNEWDPSHPRHIGVDINSIKSSKVVSFGRRCIGQQVQLHIDYDGYTSHVVLNCGHESRILEYECDLKSILPQQVQVGIAASTGSYFALHDIHFWHFNSSMEIIPHHASNSTNY